MKRPLLLVALLLWTACGGHAQGQFDFDNAYALTHLSSIDGPLAGTGIWAQMLAGAGPGALAPVGMPAEHFGILGVPSGRVSAGTLFVPGILPGQTAFVEMLAWDGSRWGTVLSGVPSDQLGMTDVVPVVLTGPLGHPPPLPHFTQSAIVPVPEPSTLAIAVILGFGALLLCRVRARLGRGSGQPGPSA